MSNDKTRLARAPLSFDIREKRRGLFFVFCENYNKIMLLCGLQNNGLMAG